MSPSVLAAERPGGGDVGAGGGGVRWRRDEDLAAGRRAQCAVLREDVQVDWADDEPGAAARGSGLGDAQAPARHARQAASVEGALLGLDGGHKHEAQ